MDFNNNRVSNYKWVSNRIFLISRLLVIVLSSIMLQVSASTYAQELNIKRKQISIRNVFREIKLQTGYDVLWSKNSIDPEKVINVSFKRTSLDKVILYCINHETLTFDIEDKTIVIKNKSSDLQDSIILKGIIKSDKGIAMPGATVKVKDNLKVTKTGANGEFEIQVAKKATLSISFVGFVNQEISLSGVDFRRILEIVMYPGQNQLGEVNVVGTGYQDLPKERATGSFEVITKEQLQHSSDPNLLKRLEGITTSMNFNNPTKKTNSSSIANRSTLYNLTIRGRNTLNVSNNDDNPSGVPLVVIDGIASPYSIDQVNPNEIESVTILKDAASASIWGSRAANGVIVIKTKRGGFGKPLNISLNTNFNISDKIDLFYKKYMSSSDYIDALAYQYNRIYDPSDTSAYMRDASTENFGLLLPQLVLNPVGEILNQQKMGKISVDQMNSQLDALRGNDVRNDFKKYILRKQFTQSYMLSIDGGTQKSAQRISLAYDKTANNTINSGNDRIVIGYSNLFRPVKNLDITANLSYNLSRSNDQGQENILSATTGGAIFPFTRLADDRGNPLLIPFKYQPSFLELINLTYPKKLLGMTYTPLDDVNEGYLKTKVQNFNINLSGRYQLIKNILSLNAIYNYNQGESESNSYSSGDSFFMRELINRFTTSGGYRNIPLGGQYKPSSTKTHTQTIRGLLNFDKAWNSNIHQLSTIAGIDLSESYRIYRDDLYYGYDKRSLLLNVNKLNYNDFILPLWGDPYEGGLFYSNIPYNYSLNDLRSRTYSLFSNAAYTYKSRYTVSASVRQDLNSELGLGTNKGGTPFYSLGGKWNIANESFYHLNWLPILQIRSTFGYNGNVNPQISARPIIIRSTTVDANTGLFTAATSDARGVSNRELRPEKTGILNLGLDFGLRNNRFSGSFEYYDKKTKDLLYGSPIDPTTGIRTTTINLANLHGWGTDITLNSVNIRNGLFSWNSTFLLSYNQVKVTKLYSSSPLNLGDVLSSSTAFEEGKLLNRMYAFRWAGLDPNTGDPRGYVNGQIISISSTGSNENFNKLYQAPTSEATYFGSSIPVYFGSLRNSINYGNLSLSASLLYKLGYYFRRPPSDIVRYSQLLNPAVNSLQGIEFNSRWQKPGDENSTNVPSLTYPTSDGRDFIYQYSDVNVLKADHIRLQEVNISYLLSKKNWVFKNARLYLNVSNLGVVWRANKLGLDPDINDYPNPRTYAFGFSANL